MMNGDGVIITFPVAGGLYDQPSLDMQIYDQIRARWNELRQEDFKKMQAESESKRPRR